MKKNNKIKTKSKKQNRKPSVVCYPTITPFPTITHVENGNLILTEDYFDSFYDKCGSRCCIRRFTWKNHNNILVQLINYGLRITSIKLPSLDGTINDIIVGYDDLSSYTYYKHHKIGAILGRVCTKIPKGTFSINGIPYSLQLDESKDYVAEDDPFCFDKTVWKSYVQGSKVIMSYIFKDMGQGYPGNLFVKVVFELTPKNEFSVDIEALTDKPTVVNISNNLYFNLCGHGSGPEHLKKHRIFMNAKTFFPNETDAIPKAVSVMNSKYDFQIPKKIQSLIPFDGSREINQNFCVNRTDEDNNQFVASTWHPSSGRMLEVYSNQPGLNFSIMGKLVGSRKIDVGDNFLTKSEETEDEDEVCNPGEHMKLLSKIYEKMVDAKVIEEDIPEVEMKELLKRECRNINSAYVPRTPDNTPLLFSYDNFSQPVYIKRDTITSPLLTHSQEKFLHNVIYFLQSTYSETNYETLQNMLQNTLKTFYVNQELLRELELSGKQSTTRELGEGREEEEEEEEIEIEQSSEKEEMTSTLAVEKEEPPPPGKNETTYKPHGAMCFRTQNHPNALNTSCILRPGEVYKHTINYKFWLKVSKSKKYWKENMRDDLKPICKS